jgi:hypothetical protein
MSFPELQQAIAERTIKDPSFRDEFVGNPKATLEKYSGQKLPAEAKVYVHLQGPKDVHFVIPDRKAIESEMKGELTDSDLEKVAGGEFFIGVAVVGAIAAAVGTGATIANDQTRARHGW